MILARSLALLLTLSLLSCNRPQPSPQNNTPGTASTAQNVALIASVSKPSGTAAPDFTWKDASGKTVSFAEVSKGKPVLLNVWATWCGPCVKEIPDLIALHQEYAAKGALIIGVSADRGDDALATVSAFVSEKGMSYPVVIDNGDLEEALGGLRGYPTTFYIDKNGVIVKKLVGLQKKEAFAAELNALL